MRAFVAIGLDFVREWGGLAMENGKDLLPVQLRWMTELDLEAVFELEQRESAHPWDALELASVLNRPDAAAMVAEFEGRIVGFIIYICNDSCLKICNIVVSKDFRRCGVGAQMMAKIACRLTRSVRDSILLEVRETNLTGQLFFRSLGFRAISIERASYDSGEDAYIMQYRHRPKVLPTQMAVY
ncbi:MAG: GNAT family N-acetyltransferase [Planctomycetia bacterium]|nr:GNAT family N-acetyltransferase [Planctomycetia bacterium]